MADPRQPLYLLADSRPLFWPAGSGSLLARMRERLPAAALRAAYIGASNADDPAFFAIFGVAMQAVGIEDCRMIASAFPEVDEEYLRRADVILLAGGSAARGWRVMSGTGMSEVLVERYHAGAALIGVSAGATHLGLTGDASVELDDAVGATGSLGFVPYVVHAHDEARDWDELACVIADADGRLRGLALPAGAAAIYHADGVLEPERGTPIEFTAEGGEVTRALLLPGEAATLAADTDRADARPSAPRSTASDAGVQRDTRPESGSSDSS